MGLIKNILAVVLLFWAVLMIQNSLFAPISTLMVRDFFSLKLPSRHFVRLNNIAPVMARSVIAAEDGKFCSHHGVDWESLHKAVNATLDDPDRAKGASTISMQVAKNLFLWPGRSYLRKVVEIPLAMALDALWGKRKMMELYLNLVELGDGVYGVEAASRKYFGVSARKMNARQAALLAAALPNPKKRNPARAGEYTSGYAGSIAARAYGVDVSCLR